jgi:hypothetical protein
VLDKNYVCSNHLFLHALYHYLYLDIQNIAFFVSVQDIFIEYNILMIFHSQALKAWIQPKPLWLLHGNRCCLSIWPGFQRRIWLWRRELCWEFEWNLWETGYSKRRSGWNGKCWTRFLQYYYASSTYNFTIIIRKRERPFDST